MPKSTSRTNLYRSLEWLFWFCSFYRPLPVAPWWMAHLLLRRVVLALVSAQRRPARDLVKTPAPPDCYVTCRAESSNCELKMTVCGSHPRTTHWMTATAVWCQLNRYDYSSSCKAYSSVLSRGLNSFVQKATVRALIKVFCPKTTQSPL